MERLFFSDGAAKEDHVRRSVRMLAHVDVAVALDAAVDAAVAFPVLLFLVLLFLLFADSAAGVGVGAGSGAAFVVRAPVVAAGNAAVLAAIFSMAATSSSITFFSILLFWPLNSNSGP
eukprot:584091-Rhodomonas_salina.2